jgi:hypothetical protein
VNDPKSKWTHEVAIVTGEPALIVTALALFIALVGWLAGFDHVAGVALRTGLALAGGWVALMLALGLVDVACLLAGRPKR